MTPFDLDFYEYSMIADDPKLLQRIQNHFYDPEFDDWLDEFDAEMEKEGESYDYSEYEVKDDALEPIPETLDLPDKETIDYVKIQRLKATTPTEENFEVLESVKADEITDWEEVN